MRATQDATVSLNTELDNAASAALSPTKGLMARGNAPPTIPESRPKPYPGLSARAFMQRIGSTFSPPNIHLSTSSTPQNSIRPELADLIQYTIERCPSSVKINLQDWTVPDMELFLTLQPRRGSAVNQLLLAIQRGQYQSPFGTRRIAGLRRVMLYLASHASQISTMELRSLSWGLIHLSSSKSTRSGLSFEGAKTHSKNKRSNIRSISSAELTITLAELTMIEF